jgi:hypothetical protein
MVAAAGALLLAGCYAVITPGGLSVGVAAPVMAFIPGTSIQVVTTAGVSGDVFFHNGVYWRCYNGHWYRRARWGGSWLTVTAVPRVFLSIPASHRAYRVVRHHPLHPRYKGPAVKTGTTSRVKVTGPSPRVRKSKSGPSYKGKSGSSSGKKKKSKGLKLGF